MTTSTPLPDLRRLYDLMIFHERNADGKRLVRDRQRERSHETTAAEDIRVEEEYEFAIASRNDARHALERAMCAHLPALLAAAEAAKQIKENADVTVTAYPDGRKYVCFDPHGVNLLELMDALSLLLSPTGRKDDR